MVVPVRSTDVTPSWIVDVLTDIDKLSFGNAFDVFTEDSEMHWGTAVVKGARAMRDFVARINAPLRIRHEISEFWDLGSVKIIRGDAHVAKKTEPADVVTAPYTHIYYLSETSPKVVDTLYVTAGPMNIDSPL